jgi:hypothetical protein
MTAPGKPRQAAGNWSRMLEYSGCRLSGSSPMPVVDVTASNACGAKANTSARVARGLCQASKPADVRMPAAWRATSSAVPYTEPERMATLINTDPVIERKPGILPAGANISARVVQHSRLAINWQFKHTPGTAQ